MPNKKIDAVITWVDGADVEFSKLREKYAKRELGRKGVQSIGLKDTRFNNIGEVEFCIRLIRKNLKFVNNIFIVTNGQVPSFYDNEFSKRFNIKLVTHKEIFVGFEKYLPTFNSRSIEAMIVNIPNISEKFLYFNDDFFISKEMEMNEFVDDEKMLFHGVYRFKNIWLDRLHRLLSNKFYIGTVGFRKESKKFPKFLFYFTPMHAPYPIDKSTMILAIKNQGGFESIIKYKFRNENQPWPIGLYLNELMHANKLVKKNSSRIGYFHGGPNSKFNFKLHKDMKMFSLQSLDALPKEEADKALSFLNGLIEK